MPADSSGLRDQVLTRAESVEDLGELLEGFAGALREVEIPLDWLSMHSLRLSPTLETRTYEWTPTTSQVVRRAEEREASPGHEDALISRIWSGLSAADHRLGASPDPSDGALVRDLKAHGITHFLIAPVPRWVQGPAALVLGTQRPEGFSEADLASLRRATDALAPAADLHETRALVRTLLRTYLGKSAAESVLRGSIRRGESEMIHAILFYSDLRDFTPLSEETAVPRLTDLLDRYFETIARPVQAAGGEILKFIGDGLLAVFPCPVGHRRACPTAQRALRVARDAQRAMADRRREEPDFDLACGVALHVGDVLFGNVGASDRLDFTVIGPAVNLVTRIESLSKRATSGIVASEDFARREGGDYDTLGRHGLKGISQPREVFSPKP